MASRYGVEGELVKLGLSLPEAAAAVALCVNALSGTVRVREVLRAVSVELETSVRIGTRTVPESEALLAAVLQSVRSRKLETL